MIAEKDTSPGETKNAIIELRIAIMDANRRKKHVECSLNDELTYGHIVSRCEAVIKFLETLEK